MGQKPGTAAAEICFRWKLLTSCPFIYLLCSYLNESSKKSTDTGFEICFFSLLGNFSRRSRENVAAELQQLLWSSWLQWVLCFVLSLESNGNKRSQVKLDSEDVQHESLIDTKTLFFNKIVVFVDRCRLKISMKEVWHKIYFYTGWK